MESFILPEKLASQLKYVATYSRYYQTLFEKAGVKLNKDITLDSFSKIPLRTPEQLREDVADNQESLWCKHAGGPFFDALFLPFKLPTLQIRITSSDACNMLNISRLLFDFLGIKHARVMADFLGFGVRSPFFGINEPSTMHATLFTLKDVFNLTVVYNFGLPAEPSASRGLFILKTFKPSWMLIDRDLIPPYENLLKQQNLTLGKMGVRQMLVIAELGDKVKPYTSEEKKKFKEAQEVSDVINLLQAAEPLFLAPECKDGSFHVFEDYYFVEAANPETGKSLPLGEEGNLAVTNLFAEGSPLIRYLTDLRVKLICEDCYFGKNKLHIKLV